MSTHLSREQACAALGISNRTLERMIADGHLHPTREGKAYVFDAAEIQARQRPSNGVVLSPPTGVATPPNPPAVAEITAEMVVDRMAEKLMERIPAGALVSAIETLGDRIGQAFASRFPARRPDAIWLTLEEAGRYSGLGPLLLVSLVRGKKVRAINDGRTKVLREDLERVVNSPQFTKVHESLADLRAKLKGRQPK